MQSGLNGWLIANIENLQRNAGRSQSVRCAFSWFWGWFLSCRGWERCREMKEMWVFSVGDAMKCVIVTRRAGWDVETNTQSEATCFLPSTSLSIPITCLRCWPRTPMPHLCGPFKWHVCQPTSFSTFSSCIRKMRFAQESISTENLQVHSLRIALVQNMTALFKKVSSENTQHFSVHAQTFCDSLPER